MDIIGWIGGILLAFCGLPEAIKSFWYKKCELSYAFIIMWLGGEILSLFYVIEKNNEVSLIPLIVNYGANILFIFIMLYYKIRRNYGEIK